ncbi:hypothetical protein [Mycobacterium gordonae]|uniref:Uncharacterized protein n=1 Tax=Mycobacterium gordonae TaxID=1778 RepID=A0A1X1VUX9_MYCGO|nr:hypothetical protein [Mycobacterium gordonae]MCV7009068.1 hypothetical protein [Mycobacterium gordonae]ODR24306.1 hypothetical protein BHQ23_01745 [Mycobacterium gordonae]ORV72872.1 hypothetical protein AWC08_03330 [Mycobacterium gordonae]
MTRPHTGPPAEATAHLPLLLIGLRWLLDTEQPAGALIYPRGQTLNSVGNRRLRFTPEGFDGRPAVVVEVSDADRPPTRNPRNTLSDSEIDDLAFVLSDCGEHVGAAWRDDTHRSAALALAASAPSSLLAAAARYRQGCPTHGGAPWCCSWYRDGSQRAISIHDVHRAAVQCSPSDVATGEPDLTAAVRIARRPMHPPRSSGSRRSAGNRAGRHPMVFSDRCVLRGKGLR